MFALLDHTIPVCRRLLSAAAATACLVCASTVTAGPVHFWEVLPSPNAGALTNQLYDVDGSSGTDIWAVGLSKDDLLDKPATQAMRWDGVEWTIVGTPNPNPSLQSNRLRGVAVAGPADAWAVGSSTFSNNTQPLLLRWDGSDWAQHSTSEFPAPSSFYDAHAIASDDVWAVGVTLGGTGFVTLAAHYDGSGWSVTDIPSTGMGSEHSLQAVHALTSDDVWATGFVNDGLGGFYPLAAHWDGSQWSSMILPQDGGFFCETHGVVVIASDDVWAVGQCDIPGSGSQPYAAHWDGSSWTVADLPLLPDGFGRLEDVAARGSNDVWAVGTDADSNGNPRPLLLHYDGNSWQQESLQSSDGSHEWFFGMACVPGGDLLAVGQYYDGSKTATLTARLSGSVPGDLDGNGVVDVFDLFALLDAWGPCSGCPEDLTGDGTVDVFDLFDLLANWG